MIKDHEILKTVIDSNPHGIAVIHKGGKWIYVNPTFTQITGYTITDISTGRDWFQKAYPDAAYRKAVIAGWAADSGRLGRGDDYEFEVTCRNGQVKHIEFRTTYLADRCISVLTDVTQRKQAEKALRSSKERYRALSDATLEAVFVSEKGYCIDTNKTACDMFGYSRNELIGIFGTDVIAPESKESVRQNMLSGYEGAYQTVAQKKDGTRFYAEIRGKMTEYEGRQVRITLVHNIDKRRKAEQALRDSEEKYRQLVDHANDAIVIAQEEKIRFFNPATSKLTGYTADELLGLPVTAFIHPEDGPAVLDRYRRRIAGENLPSTYNCRLITQEGVTKWGQINSVLTLWEGQPATLTFIRDITELKKIETRLQQAEKMESIGTLAGGIAHDFNNILASIIGYAELTLDDIQSGSLVEENLHEVIKAGKRARDLVQQILTFARQNEGRLRPVNVGALAKNVLKLLRSTIPSFIEIETRVDTTATVMADPSRIEQLFINLCSNASHAMEESGGTLTVNVNNMRLDHPLTGQTVTLPAGNYVQISVSDTGVGITALDQRSVFDPYYTTKEVGKGTGLGLSVVHGIVMGLGGEISIDSETDRGTSFTIHLPADGHAAIDTPQPQEELPGGSERILFVDDEAAIAKISGQILAGLGYRVTTRTSSLEALGLFRNDPDAFDLVISDMTMPKMTGDRLAEALTTIRPAIPIILCTGYSKQIMDRPVGQTGIKAVVYKPIAKADLATTIRRVLDGKPQKPGLGPNHH